MPTPTPPERQRAYAALAALAARELAAIWARLDLRNLDRLTDPLAMILAALSDKYGAAAAALAADWYDEARVDAAALGAFAAIPAAAPDMERLEILSRWGVGPLYGAAPRPDAALSRISGGLQRVVLDQARSTVEESAALDPAKPRFARHASANACAFCALMASRGPVYHSEASALTVVGRGTDVSTNVGRKRGRRAKGIRARGSRGLGEKYHDDCHCAVVEVFDGQDYEEAPYVAGWRETYNDVKVTGGQYGAIDLRATLAEMRKSLGTH